MVERLRCPEVEQSLRTGAGALPADGRNPQLLPVLLGLRAFYIVRGAFHTAREAGEQGLPLAQRSPTTDDSRRRPLWAGTTLFFLGNLVAARACGARPWRSMTPRGSACDAVLARAKAPGVKCLRRAAWCCGSRATRPGPDPWPGSAWPGARGGASLSNGHCSTTKAASLLRREPAPACRAGRGRCAALATEQGSGIAWVLRALLRRPGAAAQEQGARPVKPQMTPRHRCLPPTGARRGDT